MKAKGEAELAIEALKPKGVLDTWMGHIVGLGREAKFASFTVIGKLGATSLWEIPQEAVADIFFLDSENIR